MNKILFRSSVFLCVPHPHFFPIFFASIRNANKFSNNGWILTFKVSKQPYQSPLYDRIIGSGANVSLVAKNGTKKIIPLLSIKSSLVDRFKSLRCLKNRINLSYMMESLASGATNSLVAKIGTKYFATSCLVYRFWNNERILTFKVSKQLYKSLLHDRFICNWCQCLLGCQKRN